MRPRLAPSLWRSRSRLSLRSQQRLELHYARGQVLNLLLLARDHVILLLVRSLLLLDQLPLLLDLVQEHGVDKVVTDRLRGAVLAEENELRGNLGYLLGHQPVLPRLRLVEFGLVVERHRPQLHQYVALRAHVCGLVLEPPRGGRGAELARAVAQDGDAVWAGRYQLHSYESLSL